MCVFGFHTFPLAHGGMRGVCVCKRVCLRGVGAAGMGWGVCVCVWGGPVSVLVTEGTIVLIGMGAGRRNPGRLALQCPRHFRDNREELTQPGQADGGAVCTSDWLCYSYSTSDWLCHSHSTSFDWLCSFCSMSDWLCSSCSMSDWPCHFFNGREMAFIDTDRGLEGVGRQDPWLGGVILARPRLTLGLWRVIGYRWAEADKGKKRALFICNKIKGLCHCSCSCSCSGCGEFAHIWAKAGLPCASG